MPENQKPTQLLSKDKLLQDSMLTGHRGEIYAIATDNRYIISGGIDGTVRIYDKNSQKEIATLKGHSSYVSSVAIKGDTVVSGSVDNTIKIWSLKEQKEIATLKGHSRSVTSVAIDGDTVVSGSGDKSVKIWSLKSQKEIATLKGHSDSVFSVAIDGDTIVSGSFDNSIKIWSLETQEEIATLKGHSSSVYSVAIDGDTIVSGSDDESIKIWSLETQEEIATLKGHSSSVYSVAIDGDTVVSGSLDDTIKIWSIKSQKEIATLKGHSRSVFSVAIDGDTIVSGSWDNSIKIWSLKEKKEIATLKGHSSTVYSVAIDGDTIISGSWDKSIKIWSIKSQKEIATLKGHIDRVSSVAIEGDTIVSGSSDKSIKIWSIKSQKEIATLKGHIDRVSSVAIEGDTIVSGSEDKTIKIWSLKSQEEIGSLKGHSDSVSSVAIEGDTIVSGSFDNTVKIWSLKSQKEIKSTSYIHSCLAYSNSILMLGEVNGRVSFVDMNDISNPKDMTLSFDAKSPIISVSIKDGSFMFASLAGDIYRDNLPKERELSHEEQENKFSIKTLLLGDSGVGKTTLANWIEYGEYDRSIISTHGMQFFHYEFDEPIEVSVRGENESHRFALDIWDFGGQPTYQIAHKQNFDSARVILLVADMSRQNSDDNSINYWINSIKEHIGVMCKEQLGIFVIGTNSTDKRSEERRLQEVTQKIKNVIGSNIYTDSIIFDISKEPTRPTLFDKFKTYIEKCIKIETEHVLGSNSLFVLEKLQKLRKEKFGIADIESLQKDIGDDNISISDIEVTLNLLSSYGIVESLDEYILLKPYWKNIFVNAILEYASNNNIVSASIAMRDLVGYAFDVKFDKPLKAQKSRADYKSDEDIYNSEFENLDSGIRLAFIKSIIERLLEDRICYDRNGMLVFPSRFGKKIGSFDTTQYYKIDSISLVSQRNVEVTIGVVIVSLYYSDEYSIIKHLDKGVKIEDREHNIYLIEFDRKDLFTHQERQNQESTTITLYTQNDNSGKDRLCSFVEMILEDNLSPIYHTKSFKVKDLQTQEKVGEMSLTIHSQEKNYELNGFKLEEISKNRSDDNRRLSTLKEYIKSHHQKILEKIYILRDEVPKEEFKILHLSDLHFGKDTDRESELILLKQDIKAKDIDYIVLSGDLTASATKDDFRKIFIFISDLIEYFDIDAQKVIIIVGNHDYSRDITHKAYSIASSRDSKFDRDIDYRVDERIFLKRNSDKWANRFEHFSQYLYEALYNQTFPTDIEKQIKVIEDKNFVFVLINTSMEIDHFNPLKVKFDTQSFIKIQNSIKEKDKNKTKIVVGHHPLNYESSYAFSANMYKFGYKIYMHGHVHRNNLISFHDMIASKNPLIQIGAGLFSNPNTRSMIPGVPLRYNIITIGKDITINTKERQNTILPWQKAYIYPDDEGNMYDSCTPLK